MSCMRWRFSRKDDDSVDSIDNHRTFPQKAYGIQEKVLGQGVSSTVFLYRNTPQNVCYAVKSFVKMNLRDPDDTGAIKREIAVHKILNGGKYVITFIDCFTIRKNVEFLMVLEYLPIPLSKLHEKYSTFIPQVDRLCYFKQITLGLQFIQSKNIGHRDIKLENCGISAVTGNIKIFDFGSSTIGDLGYGMAGSPDYAAPEIHACLKYNSFKCDVWSLGIVLVNLFYLSKQKWKSARYDDEDFHRFKMEPAIKNIVRSSGKMDVSNDTEFSNAKPFADSLILQLLTVDVNKRIGLNSLIDDHLWFQSICCCSELPQPPSSSSDTHSHSKFLQKVLNRTGLT